MQKPTVTSVVVKISIFYLIIGLVISVMATKAAWTLQYLPVGAAERMFVPPEDSVSLTRTPTDAGRVDRLVDGTILDDTFYTLLCFICAILVMIPVANVYMATNSRKKGTDPAVIKTIILLPIAVAGLVLMVQHSLALAFSLAGLIAGAGVRFRAQIRDVSDTLYFLIAIGVGLASGVGSLGLALIMSMVYCYTALVLKALKIDRAATVATEPPPP